MICRLLLGIGMGLKASTVSHLQQVAYLQSARKSRANERFPVKTCRLLSAANGHVLANGTAFGIFLGFCANLARIPSWSARLATAARLGFYPAVPLVIGGVVLPESPRWLMKKGRYQDCLCLAAPPPQFATPGVARPHLYVHCQLEEESAAIGSSNYAQRIGQLFTIPRVRRATLASGIVMLAQQMCGINIIAFNSSTVFSDAGYSTLDSLLASWGFGAVNFLFCYTSSVHDRLVRQAEPPFDNLP